MMPSIAWEMDLGIIAYHSIKASFHATASKTHKMMGISESIRNKSEHYKNKIFNFKSQITAMLNPLDVLTTQLKNHYYSTLSVWRTGITQLGIWGNRGKKGNVLQKSKINNW